MSGLDCPINASVHFSTLIDGAAEICKSLEDEKDFPPPCGSSEPAPYYPPQSVGEGWEGSSGDPGVVSFF